MCEWAKKFICHICCWCFCLIEPKHCTTERRSVWTAMGTKVQNKFHLVTFHESILVSLWTFQPTLIDIYCPVGWGCKICQLLLCRGIRLLPLNNCLGHDTKQSDGEVLVMLELWEMQSNPSLSSVPGLLWPRLAAPDRVLAMGVK